MYTWTLLTREPAAPAYRTGVTDDLARVQREAEPYLESGEAFVCYIEKVRFALTADLGSTYVPVGLYWVGRLNRQARVTWSEHWGLPAVLRGGPGALQESLTSAIDCKRPGASRIPAKRSSRV